MRSTEARAYALRLAESGTPTSGSDQCRVAADPRSTNIQGLSDSLRGGLTIRFRTAGALRQPPEIVERLPLIDRGHSLERVVAQTRDDEDEPREHPEESPALVSLLLGQKTGIRLTINDVARELCVVWNRFQPGGHSEVSVLTAIRKFMPLDRALDPNASVRIAFAKAHGLMATTDTTA